MLETDLQAPPETPAEPESRNWTWLIVGLVVVLLMVVAGAIGWWLGSSDDETVDAPELVEQWTEAWTSGDGAALADLFAEDGVIVGYWVLDDTVDFDVPTEPGYDFEGRAGVRTLVSFVTSSWEVESVEARTVMTSDDVIVAEMIWSGETKGRREELSFTGPMIVTLELDDDGLITRSISIHNPQVLFLD